MYNHQTTDLSIFRVFVGGLDAESGQPQPSKSLICVMFFVNFV